MCKCLEAGGRSKGVGRGPGLVEMREELLSQEVMAKLWKVLQALDMVLNFISTAVCSTEG